MKIKKRQLKFKEYSLARKIAKLEIEGIAVPVGPNYSKEKRDFIESEFKKLYGEG